MGAYRQETQRRRLLSREFKNSWIFCPSILRLGYPYSDRYQALFRIFTSMSESSLRVMVLSSLVNSYPKLNTEWAKCNAQTLVNKARNWINWMIFSAPFCLFLVFWSNCHGGVYQRGAADTNLKKRIWEWASVRSFTVKCSLHFYELLIVLSTGFDSGFRQDVFTQEDYHYLNFLDLFKTFNQSFKIFNVYDSLTCNL